MRRRDHYTFSTWREYETLIIDAPITMAILLGCLFFFNELGFWHKYSWDQGDWLLFILFLILFAFNLYQFFRNIWKKRHLEDIIYLDISTEGIFLKPKSYKGRSKPTFLRWEEIEYLDLFCGLSCNIKVHIKPDQKRKPVETEFFTLQSRLGFRKAIREFSGRKDIIRRFHYGLYSFDRH